LALNVGASGNHVTDLEAWREVAVLDHRLGWFLVMVGTKNVWRQRDRTLTGADVGSDQETQSFGLAG
jgi:hypothetical protein